MCKFNAIILLVAAVAVANGQLQQVSTTNNNNLNSTLHIDDYIYLNRLQHAQNIQDFETQMELFRQTYAASIDTISIQLDMLVDSLVQTDNKLKPLEVLSDVSKKCVAKYRPSIPTASDTTAQIQNNCIKPASNKLKNLLTSPVYTRNYLDSYYKNNFESGVNGCKKTYSSLPLNYTMCVTQVVSNTDAVTVSNQKIFATQMDAAHCAGTANTKLALDCSYTTENSTISAIAVATTMIDKCLAGQDECKQCTSLNTCSEAYYMNRSEVDYNSKTMNNPFYRRTDIKDCLMLKIIN